MLDSYLPDSFFALVRQTAWVAAFPGYIAYTLFGACVSRAQFLSTLVISAGCFATPMATALGYGMSLNNYIVLAVSAGGALMVNIICASSAVRFCEDPLMKWRWITLFMLAGQVNTVYLFVMPRLLTLRSSAALGGLGLAVIRVVVHPVIWTSVLFLFRSVQRHIGRVDNLKQTAFLVWPVLYATLYGRFLLLQLEDAGTLFISTVDLPGRHSHTLLSHTPLPLPTSFISPLQAASS